MADTEPLPDWEREFLENQAAEAEHAAIPDECDHAWASKHEPGHVLCWVRQCMVCHEVDWDDLDTEIGRLMAEHKVGNTVVLVGTIVEIQGDVALVQVDKSFPAGTTTIAVRLGKLPDGDDVPSDEDLIRDAMAEARQHPGRVITR